MRKLLWEETFAGSVLDRSYWSFDLGYYHTPGDDSTWGWGNRELQFYTDSEKNSWVDGEGLHIRALPERKVFSQKLGHEALYSSARLTTRGKFSFCYGRIEIVAKLPIGVGIWPALWLLPETNEYGLWPTSGEIDLMEARGRLPAEVQGSLHFGPPWPENQILWGEYEFPPGSDIASDYHTYAIDWQQGKITWSVNGEEYYSASSEDWANPIYSNGSAPFDQKFHLMVNLAIGGAYDAFRLPDEKAIPATMHVKSIRVFE